MEINGLSSSSKDPSAKEIRIKFHVTDVHKPLLAVNQITSLGNKVTFGDDEGEHCDYIKNKHTGEVIPLRRSRGIYLLDGHFSDNGEKVSITVDSGAEDSVCPYWFGEHFGIREDVELMEFQSASGDIIGHYGDRVITMGSPF